MFEAVADAIRTHSRIILHRHSYPDGDALGSQIGLAALIRANFPDKTVFTVGDATVRYAFMEGSVMDDVPDDAYSGALAVILDSATRELVSDKRFETAEMTVRIDHHLYCETFTDVEIVDTSFESCCGMIAELAREQGWIIPKDAATAIYTGMVTDSGRFRYDSVNARTMRLAALLLEQQIDTGAIYRNLYSDDLENVLLRARVMQKITRYGDSPVAYIYNTAEELAALGIADAAQISRGMVNTMSDIRGIDVWVNFTEANGEVLCELRSSIYNINPIAVKYGGGGHKKASGASVPDRSAAMRMLADLKALTEEPHEQL